MRFTLRLALGAGVLMGVFTASAGSVALAVPGVPNPGQTIAATDTKAYTTSNVDQDCLKTLPRGMDASVCTATTTTQASAPTSVTAKQVTSDENLDTASGRALVKAAAAGTVKARNWTQTHSSNLGGVAWTEKHTGKFYYDSHYAWVSSWHGVAGNHHCNLGESIGYKISNSYCDEEGDHTGAIDNVDSYKISLTIKGVGLKSSQCMLTHTNGNGTFSQKQGC